jgi:hypothetical protein
MRARGEREQSAVQAKREEGGVLEPLSTTEKVPGTAHSFSPKKLSQEVFTGIDTTLPHLDTSPPRLASPQPVQYTTIILLYNSTGVQQ